MFEKNFTILPILLLSSPPNSIHGFDMLRKKKKKEKDEKMRSGLKRKCALSSVSAGC